MYKLKTKLHTDEEQIMALLGKLLDLGENLAYDLCLAIRITNHQLTFTIG